MTKSDRSRSFSIGFLSRVNCYNMPLKIILIDAGLAGLGAAIALNRAGHDVEV